MKKLLFLLLLTVAGYGQTYQNPTYGTVTTKTAPTSTTPPTMATVEASGVIGKITPELIPITVTPTPTHFTPTTANLNGHFQGIDNALGNIVATTAGITTRVWFTADVSVVNAVNYYSTNATGKGTAASAIQSVVNDDNQKKYFPQDLIGAPFASATVFPPGIYAGNLSSSTSPNSAQQRYTVELYKTNNLGVPIASGVTGAPVGSLGVTVIVILDSGLLTLADGSVSNVQVSGNLGGTGFSIAVGERIRYHVSAEKVGTAAATITQSVYYGTSYNSFIDVPVTFKGSTVANDSGVSGATVTDALNTLNTGKQNTLTNPVTGTGTTNFVSKWTAASTQGNSQFFDIGASDSGVTNSSYSTFRIKGNTSSDTGGGVLAFDNQTKRFAEITGETFSTGNAVINFRSLTSGTVTNKMSIVPDGAVIIANATPNGVDKLIVNGTASGSPATSANQFVTLSQANGAIWTSDIGTLLNSNVNGAVTFKRANYTRNGNIITGSIAYEFRATAANTYTTVKFTLPVPTTNATNVGIGSGTGSDIGSLVHIPTYVLTDSSNSVAVVTCAPTNISTHVYYLTFQYSTTY